MHQIVTVNMFVNEMVRVVAALRSEDVIVRYLAASRSLPYGICTLTISLNKNRNFRRLGRKTQLRLNSLLLDYSTPGSPYYPTRKIREESVKTLDKLFPVRLNSFQFV